MGSGSGSSKELLHLEHNTSSNLSTLESALLVCGKKKEKQAPPQGKPFAGPLPQSQVLGRVKDFLGVLSDANKRLEQDAKDNAEIYDIEALTGDESQVIEMDLMLGVADLHTPEAMAAAESAIADSEPIIHLDDSETESEDTSDDESDEDNDDDKSDEQSRSASSKHEDSTCKMGNASESGHKRSRKRPKIVEMP